MKTPWQYAEAGTEHSHQVALFMWANMAALWGAQAANDPKSYTMAGFARTRYLSSGGGGIPLLKWLHAIHNQGHGDRVRGARASAEGVKSGVPDLFLPVPSVGEEYFTQYYGLYIELKRPGNAKLKEGKLSVAQSEWLHYLSGAGYYTVTCYGWEAARDAILKYLGR